MLPCIYATSLPAMSLFPNAHVTSNDEMMGERWTGEGLVGRSHGLIAAFVWKDWGKVSNNSG